LPTAVLIDFDVDVIENSADVLGVVDIFEGVLCVWPTLLDEYTATNKFEKKKA
jgi:hypothetical protein